MVYFGDYTWMKDFNMLLGLFLKLRIWVFSPPLPHYVAWRKKKRADRCRDKNYLMTYFHRQTYGNTSACVCVWARACYSCESRFLKYCVCPHEAVHMCQICLATRLCSTMNYTQTSSQQPLTWVSSNPLSTVENLSPYAVALQARLWLIVC